MDNIEIPNNLMASVKLIELDSEDNIRSIEFYEHTSIKAAFEAIIWWRTEGRKQYHGTR